MDTKICGKCGTSNTSNALYCSHCGNSLNAKTDNEFNGTLVDINIVASKEPIKTVRSKKYTPILIIGGIAAVCLVIALFVFIFFFKNQTAAEIKPTHYGVFIKQGSSLIELAEREIFDIPTADELNDIEEIADTQPHIIVWQQSINLDYLSLYALGKYIGQSQQIQYTATPKENGIFEISMKSQLNAGSYCIIQSDPLSITSSGWCFKIGSKANQSLPSQDVNTPNTASSGNIANLANNLKVAILDDHGGLQIQTGSGMFVDGFQISIIEKPQILWSPNGKYIVVAEYPPVRNIYLVDLDKRTVQKWGNVPDGISYLLEWSPTSDRLLISTRNDFDSSSGLYIASMNGTNLTKIFQGWSFASHVSWGPDGNILEVEGSPSGTKINVFIINASTGKSTDMTPPDLDSEMVYGWLEDGRLLVRTSKGSEYSWKILNPTTGSVSDLMDNPPSNIRYVMISPSGKKIAYTLGTSTENGQEFTINIKAVANSSSKEVYSFNSAIKDCWVSSWSPSEEYLIFGQYSNGQIITYLENLNSGKVDVLDGDVEAYYIQRTNPISVSKDWISETAHILIGGDIYSNWRKILLSDVDGQELELCNALSAHCVVWAP